MEAPNVPLEFVDLVLVDGVPVEKAARDLAMERQAAATDAASPLRMFELAKIPGVAQLFKDLDTEEDLAKASSGPGRIRQEIEMVDGVRWVHRYDYRGHEIEFGPALE